VARNRRLFLFVGVSAILTLIGQEVLNEKFAIINIGEIGNLRLRDLYGVGATIYTFIAITVMGMIIVRLQRPGMNPELKRNIAWRYSVNCLAFVILQFPAFWLLRPDMETINQEIEGFDSLTSGGTYFVKSYGTVILASGMLTAFIRLREPILTDKIMSILKCSGEGDEAQSTEVDNSKGLLTSLRTSLNTELVISILKGITILAASSSDKDDHMDEQDMLQVEQKAIINIKRFKINDAKQFDTQRFLRGRKSTIKQPVMR
jgi:hypothetical protein